MKRMTNVSIKRSVKTSSAASALLFLFHTTSCLSASINPNTQYVGYDWIESRKATQNFTLSADQVHQTIGHSTNLNVVDTIEGLNSGMCTSYRCAIRIHAGQSHFGLERLDICPSWKEGEALNYTECKDPYTYKEGVEGYIKGVKGYSDGDLVKDGDGNYSKPLSAHKKIWSIADEISNAVNVPLAIYFIDEPELNDALQGENGVYLRYSYPSYVCTLREALASKGLSHLKIFTILSNRADIDSVTTGNQDMIKDVRYQMPYNGCKSGANSRPDWIGFDNYNWTTAEEIHDKYARNFGEFSTVEWIFVPPATDAGHNLIASTDAELRSKIQPYWNYIVRPEYRSSPVVGMMYFRLDPEISNQDQNPSWPTSRSLLRYMANRIFEN